MVGSGNISSLPSETFELLKDMPHLHTGSSGRTGTNQTNRTHAMKGNGETLGPWIPRFLLEHLLSDLIVREMPNGGTVRVKDVARVQLGSQDYSIVSLLNGNPCAAIAVYQLPGTNAVQAVQGPLIAPDDSVSSLPASRASPVSAEEKSRSSRVFCRLSSGKPMPTGRSFSFGPSAIVAGSAYLCSAFRHSECFTDLGKLSRLLCTLAESTLRTLICWP
jgi:hypothetical protein